MTQIASEDYVNKLIYLHVDTATSGFDPALMQQEHRTRRRLNAGGERKFDPMVTFSGNEQIGPGLFTPGITRLRTSVRVVPYDTPHSLDVLSQIVNVDDGVSDRDIFDRSGVASNVDIDSTYSPVEVREVNTGSGLSATESAQLDRLHKDRGLELGNPVLIKDPGTTPGGSERKTQDDSLVLDVTDDGVTTTIERTT